MAEKEERIIICRSTDYTITDTAEGARFDSKIAPHCANVFTRQEAIEKIEKHLIASTIEFNTTADVVAEIALNALLEK